MFKMIKKEISWGGQTLTLETGRIARQADGAVLATMGQTSVLCTVVSARKARADIDFFPLTVIYQEKTYAVGRIPGGFFKREAKPSDHETLTSRLIDRPLRPLFPEGYFHETQVICTVLSHDKETPSDIVALVGASAALAISGIPFYGPVGGARVAYIDGQYVLNPTVSQQKESTLDLVVAGTREGVLMVESEAQELSEEIMLDAVTYGHQSFQGVIQAIEDMAAEVAPVRRDEPVGCAVTRVLYETLKERLDPAMRAAYANVDKAERESALNTLRDHAIEQHASQEIPEKKVKDALKRLERDIVRGDILNTGRRIDGRDTQTVRPIKCEAGWIPGVHGSALFTRGETQAMVFTTLGTAQDEQIIDGLTGDGREGFMLHYNFPPYSVGEAGRMGPPGRREIGHGKLAWRAIRPMMPTKDQFPYTVRTVSEITESNGSSSMATVCGTSLSLMDAGVPLKRPVAGIAMGLIKESEQFAVLSDILGAEDALGDMDFKVAGTAEGITALQMDIKITSITQEIMTIALEQAKKGRMHILQEMTQAISSARESLRESAPRIVSVRVPQDKIGEIIGPGGRHIRELCETTNTRIDIEEDGKVNIAGTSDADIQAAVARIQGMTAQPEMGGIYKAKVVKIVEFGAFIEIFGKQQGLLHVSQLRTTRVEDVNAVLKVGDQIFVEVLDFDPKGRPKFSMKTVDQTTGEKLENVCADN